MKSSMSEAEWKPASTTSPRFCSKLPAPNYVPSTGQNEKQIPFHDVWQILTEQKPCSNLKPRLNWKTECVVFGNGGIAKKSSPYERHMPETMIPVAKPFLDQYDAEAATRAILSGWVTQGPEVAAFEREFSSYIGAPFACAVSSCTAALHLALLAAGGGPGGEVITVSTSFIATANSIRYCGATPVFVDIQPATFNIDPALIEEKITRRTRAILCVHQIGMPCDLKSITALAHRHQLAVI